MKHYAKHPLEETSEMRLQKFVTIFNLRRLTYQPPRHEGAVKQKESPNMKMHKVSLLITLAAGALIAFTPTLRAEDKPDRPERPERPAGGPGGAGGGQRGDMMKKMAEELSLSDEQKTKLQEVFKAQREAMKDLSPEERREKGKETREAMDAKVKAILTAEQYAKWEKIRQERRPGGPGNEGGAGGAGENRRGPGAKGEKPAKN